MRDIAYLRHKQRRDYAKKGPPPTQREERGLTRYRHYYLFYLGYLPSRLCKGDFFCLSHTLCGLLQWQPALTNRKLKNSYEVNGIIATVMTIHMDRLTEV